MWQPGYEQTVKSGIFDTLVEAIYAPSMALKGLVSRLITLKGAVPSGSAPLLFQHSRKGEGIPHVLKGALRSQSTNGPKVAIDWTSGRSCTCIFGL